MPSPLASSPLISSGDLIVDSWVTFRKNVATYAEFAMWFAFLAVARWAITAGAAATISTKDVRYAMDVLLSLPVFFLHAVLTVAIIDAASRQIANRAGTVRESLYAGFARVISALGTWVAGGAVLVLGLVLAIGGASMPPLGVYFILPGIILLVPGTWLAIRWFFAAYATTVERMSVRDALKASATLVQDRWWAVFWRTFFPWMFFYVATYFVTSVGYLIIGLACGNPGLYFGQLTTAQNLPNTYLLLSAVFTETVNGAALPLFVMAGMLLWNDLRKSA